MDFHKLSTIFNFHQKVMLYVVEEKLYWNAHCLTRYVVVGLDLSIYSCEFSATLVKTTAFGQVLSLLALPTKARILCLDS
jgi:hypothetical protein